MVRPAFFFLFCFFKTELLLQRPGESTESTGEFRERCTGVVYTVWPIGYEREEGGGGGVLPEVNCT